MAPWLIALVLSTAVLHASWNALLRRGADPVWTGMVIAVTTGTVSLPLLLLLPIPAAASWPYLFASFVIHIGYRLFLSHSYRWGDLSAVYPIARGSAPMLVTVGAAVIAGETLPMLAFAGIALVSLGVFSLSRPRLDAPIAPRALVLALITGACIAGYMVADGMGARLSGNAIAYALWLEVVNAFPLPTILLVTRGTLRTEVRGETWRAIAAGLMSMGYVAVVWAMSLGAMGAVSALRETSVVFAALIGRFLLHEQFGWRRFLAAAVIALGIVAIGLAR